MKTAQLIKVTESTLFLKDGLVISEVLTSEQKLMHAIYGETKAMRVETVVEIWHVKTQKDANVRFWDYMTENKIEDPSIYYVVFA